MSTKNRPSKSDPNTVLAANTASFWGKVEQRCKTLKGIPIHESPYYGLRPSDYVIVSATVNGQELLKRKSITDLWRSFCVRMGFNADLHIASQLAVQHGFLKSSNRSGKDPNDPTKKRSFGVQFWTPSNPVYLGKKTGSVSDKALTNEALMDSLLAE